jgi:serine/threonine protein kinase/tetratricopeptide (TPR) repeat protein
VARPPGSEPLRLDRTLLTGTLASRIEECVDPIMASREESSSRGDEIEAGPAPARLARGASVGRYVILEHLGSGGMGAVYRAYDPELDRAVALKLLSTRAGSPSLRERLIREAQALARLSHPNVVAVHDAGTFRDDVFITIELVEGETLRTWLLQERTQAQILDVFMAAGEGLLAAHRAGLVHRDFKPDNVMIGSDGRARVLDFGVARMAQLGPAALLERDAAPRSPVEPVAGDDETSDAIALTSPTRETSRLDAGDTSPPGTLLARPLTADGKIVGTPRYMSPEQHRGGFTDERADQFSFCLVLYHALYRAYPYPGNTDKELRENVLADHLSDPPPGSRVPRWLRRVLLRGLAVDPAARYPSMAALLTALGDDPRRARNRRLRRSAARATVVAVAVASAAAAIGVARHAREQRGAACAAARARLHDVWDGPRRSAAKRAFAATGAPYAADTFARVAAVLDRYSDAWVAMHEESCRATRVERRQSDSLFDLRMSCLDRRRSALAALTGQWAAGVDAEALENAITVSSSLPALDECADARALTERLPLPRDSAARQRIDETRALIDRARALRDAKRLREARSTAETAQKRASAEGYAPLAAEASFVLGSLLHAYAQPDAIEPLEEATRRAAQAGDDRLAADAAVELMGAMVDGGMAPSALTAVPLAEALVVRAGNHPAQRGALLVWQGAALLETERGAEAVATLSEARELLTRSLGSKDPLTLNAGLKLFSALYSTADFVRCDALGRELLAAELEVLGPDHPQTGALLSRLGLAATRAGDFTTARRQIERAIAIAERAYGPISIPVTTPMNTLGVLEETEGHLDAAARQYERVLAIRRQLLAADHALVAHALANLAGVRRLQHRFAEALTDVATALTIMRHTFGDDHADVAYELGVRAEIQAAEGDIKAARASYQQAIAMWSRVKGARNVSTAYAMLYLAELDARSAKCQEARQLLDPAQSVIEGAYGTAHPTVALILATRARCDLDERGEAELAPLERALRIIDRPEGAPPSDRGLVRFELARALWAAGARERSVALAKEAEQELTQSGGFGERDRERARAWLRSH